MKIGEIEIKNYRSFAISNPIKFEVFEGITFILGVNNIGKSNLIKQFFELRPAIKTNTIRTDNFQNAGNLTNSNFGSILNQGSHNDEIYLTITANGNTNDLILKSNGNLNSKSFKIKGKDKGVSHLVDRDEFGKIKEIYENSIYIASFRTPSFSSTGSYFDIKIGSDFIKTWDQWANGADLIKRRKIIDLKLELKELFEFTKFDISVTPQKNNLIINIDTGSFLLDELGGGIGHFILVLGNALISEPSFILIDEPENALHPKLQQTFISTLASKASIGLIATSHSIALARSTADYIYSLTRNQSNGNLNLKKYGESYKPTISSPIRDLGYSQFVELGGNNILLVEGRTDIKSFREILRKYGIDSHFIIMDLGGANMINIESSDEIDEILRLNANSYSLIFDSERTSERDALKPKFQAFKEMCEEKGINVFATDYHSTDNYINQDALNQVVGNNFPELGKYESLESQNRKDTNTKWGNNLNWKMFRLMNKEDFEGTELNDFILNELVTKVNTDH